MISLENHVHNVSGSLFSHRLSEAQIYDTVYDGKAQIRPSVQDLFNEAKTYIAAGDQQGLCDALLRRVDKSKFAPMTEDDLRVFRRAIVEKFFTGKHSDADLLTALGSFLLEFGN